MPPPPKKMDNLLIENANVMFRNFAGRAQTYNTEGDRNFCIFLEPDQAAYLKGIGYNVKQLRVKEEGDLPQDYLQVSMEYRKGRPPRVVVVTHKGKVDYGIDEIPVLDFADVKNWDVLINPFPWDVNGNQGIKAYLKAVYVTLDEDELEMRYSDVPDAEQSPTTSSTASEEMADA